MSDELEATYGMECYVCGKEILTSREDQSMPEGWGFVLVHVERHIADGRPGLEPMYACPDCKDPDA